MRHLCPSPRDFGASPLFPEAGHGPRGGGGLQDSSSERDAPPHRPPPPEGPAPLPPPPRFPIPSTGPHPSALRDAPHRPMPGRGGRDAFEPPGRGLGQNGFRIFEIPLSLVQNFFDTMGFFFLFAKILIPGDEDGELFLSFLIYLLFFGLRAPYGR